MKLLIEDYTYYETEDLLDLVLNCKNLKSPTKKVVYNFVSDISIQLSELYHQLNRKPLGLEVYKQLSKINNNFADFILYLLETSNIHKSDITTRIKSFKNLIQNLVKNVEYYITTSMYNQLNDCFADIESICDNFISRSTPIIINTRDRGDLEKTYTQGLHNYKKLQTLSDFSCYSSTEQQQVTVSKNTPKKLSDYTKNNLHTVINKPTNYVVKPSSLQHRKSTQDFSRRKLTINNKERNLNDGK